MSILITILKIIKCHLKQRNITKSIDCSHQREAKRTKACLVQVIISVGIINLTKRPNRDSKTRPKMKEQKERRKY